MDPPRVSDENVRPQPGHRKRPLRTYGRRAQLLPQRETEPPRKKRALEDNSDGNDSPRADSYLPSSPQLPKLPVQTSAQSVKRGSILAFFKPVPAPTSSSGPESQVPSDATRTEMVPSSPPSSPPSLPRPMKTKRRLTTRINSLRDLEEEEGQKENKPIEEDDMEAATTVGLAHSEVLQDPKSSLRNPSVPPNGTPADGGFKVKHEAKRRLRKATVQTTLNLSTAAEPGFTICKECDLLYNPLNEKDRKDHARQHAAVMRRKGRDSVS
ncbi:hypothetical protein NKR19_g3737 [Coniochaeta hoffmannii]|uniref:N-acetyltransferase ESCO zinc-finger domain-containing protein n=1 Tax=Coniochaeta hoffmannii TaxID=91930 RepID=A0AA38W149_9PEZI|nr:hypothetical protein NKR19_g3737 [Coniochaeta hoffmannii]